jgi:hypothetical protein
MEQQGEDEPNTPSKSKMLPRRPMGLYAVLLLFVVIGGKFSWIDSMSAARSRILALNSVQFLHNLELPTTLN